MVLAAGPAAADPPRHTIEVDLSGGYDVVSLTDVHHGQEVWSRRGGGSATVGLTYRSPYFLSPFLDVGYYPIFASQSVVDVGSYGGRVRATGTLDAIAAFLGPALDLGRFRIGAGVGAYQLHSTASVNGSTFSTRELHTGYALDVSFYLLRESGVSVGLDSRATIIQDSDIVVLTLGATVGADVISF